MRSFIAVLRGPDHVFEFVNSAHREAFGDRDLIGRARADDMSVGILETRAFFLIAAYARIKTVKSRSLATGLITSLLQRLELDVAGLPLGGVASALGQLLSPLGPVLDGAINPVLDVLGLKLGEADVAVLGLSCPATGRAPPRLVG